MKKWREKKHSYSEGLRYMEDRRTGKIKSILTPWSRLNEAGIAGLEFGTCLVVAARPGNFKTAIKDQILNNISRLNPGLKYRVLDFRFEMSGRTLAIREFSSFMGMSYKDLCSAERAVHPEIIKRLFQYAKEEAAKQKESAFDTVDDPCTVTEFDTTVQEYMEEHKDSEGRYTPTIIALDHTRLLEPEDKETEEKMIHRFSKVVIRLKRKYPIIFIILSQLNRGVEEPSRKEDGKSGNYISSADIFASDALFQAGDQVIGINRPALLHISYYGPQRFIITGDDGFLRSNLLVWHFLKVRNGDLITGFCEAIGERMEIVECEAPPMAQSTKSSIGKR